MTPGGSLARQYSWILSVSLVSVLLIAAAVEIAFATRENVARVQEFRLSEARAFERRIAFFVEGVERTIGAIAASPWADGISVAERVRDYQRAMRMLPAIRDVTLVDGEGRERLFLSRVDSTRVDSMVVRDDVPAGATATASFGAVKRYGEQRVPHVTMSIRDRRGDGVSMVTLNLQFVSDELAQLAGAGLVEALVVDESGAAFARSETRGRGQVEDLPRPEHSDKTGTAWTRDGKGEFVLAVWHALERPAWKVVVMTPWRDALAPVIQTAGRTMILAVVAIALSILLGRFMADRMARPILVLERGARALGTGELGHRIALNTGNELEVLASAFNTMAAQLQEHTAGLERKVEERTTALKEALELAREAMRARSLFLAAASHDLRQPLYAISILADTLAAEDLPQSSSAVLEKQREAIGILRSLFDNLLDLSRLEAGEVRPHLRDGSVREILAPVGLQYEALCQSRGLGWECDLPDTRIRSDPELLQRVVGNLLSNAVRYTDRGSVALSARRIEDRLEIVVADTGIGIASEDQARIFDEFVQLDSVARDREKGVGLGLSIVKRIDGLLGLGLSLTSQRGTGTTISMRVPCAPEPAKAARSSPADVLAG